MSALRKAFLLMSICIAIDYVASRRYTERDDYFGAIVGDNDMMDEYYDIAYDEMLGDPPKAVKTNKGGQKKMKVDPKELAAKKKELKKVGSKKFTPPTKPPTTKIPNTPPQKKAVIKATEKQVKKLDLTEAKFNGLEGFLKKKMDKKIQEAQAGIDTLKKGLKLKEKINTDIRAIGKRKEEALKSPLSSITPEMLSKQREEMKKRRKKLKKETAQTLASQPKNNKGTKDKEKEIKQQITDRETKNKEKKEEQIKKMKRRKTTSFLPQPPPKKQSQPQTKLKRAQSAKNLNTPKTNQSQPKTKKRKKRKTSSTPKDKSPPNSPARQSYLNNLIDQYYYDQELALRILAKERRQIQRIKQQQQDYDDDDYYYY